MKKIILLTPIMFLLLTVTSCKHNYQVKYARVAVDSLQQKNDSADSSIEEVFSDDSFDDIDVSSEESVFEIPEIPRETTVQSGSNPRKSRQASDNEENNSGKEQY